MLRRAAIAIAAGTLVIAACSSGEGSEVQPFADIQASDITLEFDPAATTATLRVDTSIPVVCAVAFGTTDALGLIATDDDMAGTAHADHHPRLTGLEPETEYSYRLQGVDAAGKLYQSDLMTFTTPAASEASSSLANVALGATVVEVSSEFSAGFSADKALDGDIGTEWSSAGDGDDAFMVIDLGAPVEAVAVGFQTRSMSDGTSITLTYTVTVDDGETLGPFPVGDEFGITDVSFTGQVIRFDVDTSTGGNTGAVELAVYAAP